MINFEKIRLESDLLREPIRRTTNGQPERALVRSRAAARQIGICARDTAAPRAHPSLPAAARSDALALIFYARFTAHARASLRAACVCTFANSSRDAYPPIGVARCRSRAQLRAPHCAARTLARPRARRARPPPRSSRESTK